jgi:hypothetical protein
MVKRYAKDGSPYDESPYTKAEIAEIEKTLYATPIGITRAHAQGEAPARPTAPPYAPIMNIYLERLTNLVYWAIGIFVHVMMAVCFFAGFFSDPRNAISFLIAFFAFGFAASVAAAAWLYVFRGEVAPGGEIRLRARPWVLRHPDGPLAYRRLVVGLTYVVQVWSSCFGFGLCEPFTPSEFAFLGIEIALEPRVGSADQRAACLRIACLVGERRGVHVAFPAVGAVVHGLRSSGLRSGLCDSRLLCCCLRTSRR